MHKTSRNLFRIVSLYAFCLLGFELLGQLVIRYFEWRRPTGIVSENILSHQEPVLGFGLKKNLREYMPGNWTVVTNSLGFRDGGEIAIPKPKDEIRIFVVGGSTVFGWALDGEKSIPGQLQKISDEKATRNLASIGKKVRIINAGVPWYSSWHEAALILFRILPLEPDAIVILDGLNDVATAINPTWTPIHLGFIDFPTQISYQKRQASTDKKNFLVELSKISPTLRYFQAKMKQRTQLNQGVYRPELWDQYLYYMDWLYRITSSLDIRFFVLLQPVICVDREILRIEEFTNFTSLKIPAFAETFRRVYLEGERRLVSQKSFPFRSLKSVFKNTKEPIYIDGLHYSELGNKMLARHIFEDEISPYLSGFMARFGSR